MPNEKTNRLFRARIVNVLQSLGFRPDQEVVLEKGVKDVRSVFESDKQWKKKFAASWPPAQPAIRNAAILKLWLGFTNADIRAFFATQDRDEKVLLAKFERKELELRLRAASYQVAVPQLADIKAVLRKGGKIDEIDLPFDPNNRTEAPSARETSTLPTYLFEEIDRIRAAEKAQDGDVNSQCRVIELYIEMGATKVASMLLDEGFANHPEFPGFWYQKARLLMALAERQRLQAARYNLMSAESEVLSAAEGHWSEMAADAEGGAYDLRAQVFDCCVRALSLLPDREQYEENARRWSSDYGKLRDLRNQLLLLIVQEAGWRCDPYSNLWDAFHQRVLARLGRLETIQNDRDPVAEKRRITRLRNQPLFSNETDALVVSAYNELFGRHSPLIDSKDGVRLLGLNFLRLLLPKKEYQKEVMKFVERLKQMYAEYACRILGPFDGLEVGGRGAWRMVMHEHLDAVLTRDEQRALVEDAYARWVDFIQSLKNETKRAIYDDEVRQKFDQGDHLGSFVAACGAEKEGVYRQDDGRGALILRCAAEWLLDTVPSTDIPQANKDVAERVLADDGLCGRAEEYYMQSFDDIEYGPPAFLAR